jgi:lipoprotein-anchoring transpeptidase ErfK/SrfK
MAKSELISRSFMAMNFGAAALLIATGWQSLSGGPQPTPISTSHAVIAPVGKAAEPRRMLANASTSVSEPLTTNPSPRSFSLFNFLSTVFGSRDTIAEKNAAVITPSSTELVVDLSDRQVYLYKQGKMQAMYAIGVGQPGWETPVGRFQVTHMEVNPTWQHPITRQAIPPGPDNPLGSRWIGFWNTGEYEIGFHGTNQPETVGGAVSHGCLRMYDADIKKLYPEIKLGTVVVVRP